MRASELVLSIPGDCLCSFLEVFGGEYKSPVTITGPVTVLDIGANVGAFALWAREMWPQSTIHSYEPHPDLFPFLTANTRHLDRMHRHNAAVGDSTANRLVQPEGRGRVCCKQSEDNGILIMVVHPSFLPEADVVKIDTEGAEADILNNFRFSPKVLMVEWHNEANRAFIDSWASGNDMNLIKTDVRAVGLGVSVYAKGEGL